MRLERAIFLGAPAAGKGTQARRLGELVEIPVGSTGQMLRDEENAKTGIGLHSIELSKTGTLVSDDIMMSLVERWMGRAGKRFLFDGFPRTIFQATALDKLLADQSLAIDAVFEIQTPEAICRERAVGRLTCLACGLGVPGRRNGGAETCCRCGGGLVRRRDDSPDVFDLRMSHYREKTLPLIEFYRSRGILTTIDGAGTADEVFDLLRLLVE